MPPMNHGGPGGPYFDPYNPNDPNSLAYRQRQADADAAAAGGSGYGRIAASSIFSAAVKTAFAYEDTRLNRQMESAIRSAENEISKNNAALQGMKSDDRAQKQMAQDAVKAFNNMEYNREWMNGVMAGTRSESYSGQAAAAYATAQADYNTAAGKLNNTGTLYAQDMMYQQRTEELESAKNYYNQVMANQSAYTADQINDAKIQLTEAQNNYDASRQTTGYWSAMAEGERSAAKQNEDNLNKSRGSLENAKNELEQKRGDADAVDRDARGQKGGAIVETALLAQCNELYTVYRKIQNADREIKAAQKMANKWDEGGQFDLKGSVKDSFQKGKPSLKFKEGSEDHKKFISKRMSQGFSKEEAERLFKLEKMGRYNVNTSITSPKDLISMAGSVSGFLTRDDHDEDTQALRSMLEKGKSVTDGLTRLEGKRAAMRAERKAVRISRRPQTVKIKKVDVKKIDPDKALKKLEKQTKKTAKKAQKATRKTQKKVIRSARDKALNSLYSPFSLANGMKKKLVEWAVSKTVIGGLVSSAIGAVASFMSGIAELVGGAALIVFSACCGITAILVILFFVSALLDYSVSPSETATYLLYRSLQYRETQWKEELETPSALYSGVKKGDFRFGKYYMRWEDYASMKNHMIYYDERLGLGAVGEHVQNNVYINPLDFVPAYPDEYFTAIGEEQNVYKAEWYDAISPSSIDWSDAEMVTAYRYAYDREQYYAGKLYEYDPAVPEPFIQLPIVNDGTRDTADPDGDGHYEFDTLYKYTGPTWEDGTPFTPGAFGDAGIMVNYMPNLSEQAPYGNGGHTSNVKDIICMMDVMFQFEANDDAEICDRLDALTGDDPIAAATEYIWDLVCTGAKLLHNIFMEQFMNNPDNYKWPLDTELDDYMHMKEYCEILFEASHQEMLDIDVILFDCTKAVGEDGYLMTDDDELGTADAADSAYLETHLGSLLHQGCPMKDEGGCKESKFYGVIYSFEDPDMWAPEDWGTKSVRYDNDDHDTDAKFNGTFVYSYNYRYSNADEAYNFHDIVRDPYDGTVDPEGATARRRYNNERSLTRSLRNFNANFGLGTVGYPQITEYVVPGDPSSGIASVKADTNKTMIGVVGKLDRYEDSVPQFSYLTFVDDEHTDQHPYCLPINLRNALTAEDLFPESGYISNGRGNLNLWSKANMESLWRNCGGDPKWIPTGDGDDWRNDGGCWYRWIEDENGDENGGVLNEYNLSKNVDGDGGYWPMGSLCITCNEDRPECDEEDDMDEGNWDFPYSGPYGYGKTGDYKDALFTDGGYAGVRWDCNHPDAGTGRNTARPDFVLMSESPQGDNECIVLGWYEWVCTDTKTVTYECSGHYDAHPAPNHSHWSYCGDEHVTYKIWEKQWTFYIWGTCFKGNTGFWDDSTGIDGEGNNTTGKMVPYSDDGLNNSWCHFSKYGSLQQINLANKGQNLTVLFGGDTSVKTNANASSGTTCAGHTCKFCGGHTLVDVKGIVFSFTDEEIIAAGGKTGGDTAVQPGDFKLIPVYNQECLDKLNAAYGKNDNGGASNKAYYSHLGRAYGDYRSDTSADNSANWSAHISDDPEKSLFARDYYSKVGVHGMNMWVDHSYWAGQEGLLSNVHPNVSGSVMEKLESVRTYPDGFAWRYITKEDDVYTVNRMLWYGEDIFDIDASIDYPYGLFPVEASDYQGWTETNMTLALTKYIMSWEDTYCFDIPVNFSSPQLSDSQIDDIIKAVGGSSMPEGQKKAVTLALQAVGNGQYSQEHHDHAYLSYQCSRYTSGSGLDKLNGLSTHTCTATDASGFASYIMNIGEQTGKVWDTDDFKAKASPWGGWSSAKGALKPGDIIVYYPDFDVSDPEFYGQDAGHHVMVYIGTPTEDLNITWLSRDGQQSFRAYDADGNPLDDPAENSDGDVPDMDTSLFEKARRAITDPDAPIVFEPGATFKAQYYITFKAGEPIFVDCNRLDQTGNIYLRGGYACTGDPTSGMSETGYFYYADQQLMENIYSGAYMYKYRPGY